MATASGAEDPGVARENAMEQILREDPCSFEFFQAVTLLQRLWKDRQPVGRFSNPEDEAVHFRANNNLAFPASQIQQIDWPNSSPPRMSVNFMGLTGPMGVLPYCYTELILERARAKDKTLPAFLDIFNHRMISLFYRAWEKYRFPVTYYLGDEDLFTHHLLDLIGLGTSGLQDRQDVPDSALLHYVALLGQQSRSASALETILRDYFEVSVEIEQFSGAWYRLDPTNQCSMQENDSESQQLGLGAVVGDAVWDEQSRVRIKLGPMELSRYNEFLPDGPAFAALRAITRFFINDQLDFEVQLVLKREDVPDCEIGFEGDIAPRLGWVTWMKPAAMDRDPSETVLKL
ncbi:MAG TPA: type VI secretion system baseplate subunit TssG [Terriglobales bacterium]